MDEILASIRKIIAEEPRGLGLAAADGTRTIAPAMTAATAAPPSSSAATVAPAQLGTQAAAASAAPGTANSPASIPQVLRELAAAIPRAEPAVVSPSADDDLSDLLEPASGPAQTRPAGAPASTERVESALDALAAGLAGGAAARQAPAVLQTAMPVEPPPPSLPQLGMSAGHAPDIAEPVESAPAAASAASHVAYQAAPAEVAEASPALNGPMADSLASAPLAAPRTLEDAVVEMLRPLLRSWLDENLPALVERALQAELEEMSKAHQN
jgi:cell pole-organizing protein PopZ